MTYPTARSRGVVFGALLAALPGLDVLMAGNAPGPMHVITAMLGIALSAAVLAGWRY